MSKCALAGGSPGVGPTQEGTRTVTSSWKSRCTWGGGCRSWAGPWGWPSWPASHSNQASAGAEKAQFPSWKLNIHKMKWRINTKQGRLREDKAGIDIQPLPVRLSKCQDLRPILFPALCFFLYFPNFPTLNIFYLHSLENRLKKKSKIGLLFCKVR